MKSEIRCGNCGAVWHLEAESTVGEMLCPVCLAKIEIDSSAVPTPEQGAPETSVAALP